MAEVKFKKKHKGKSKSQNRDETKKNNKEMKLYKSKSQPKSYKHNSSHDHSYHSYSSHHHCKGHCPERFPSGIVSCKCISAPCFKVKSSSDATVITLSSDGISNLVQPSLTLGGVSGTPQPSQVWTLAGDPYGPSITQNISIWPIVVSGPITSNGTTITLSSAGEWLFTGSFYCYFNNGPASVVTQWAASVTDTVTTQVRLIPGGNFSPTVDATLAPGGQVPYAIPFTVSFKTINPSTVTIRGEVYYGLVNLVMVGNFEQTRMHIYKLG